MKKLLSVLLVAVMLFSSIGLISVVAAEPTPALSYTVTGVYNLSSKTTAQKELFNLNLTIDSSKIAALDGESKDYTYQVDSIVANGIDYMTDEDAFFDAFQAEEYAGTVLEVTFTVNFESDKVFGTLDYSVNVMGFMAPLSVGLGPVDDALANVSLPIDVAFDGNVWQFPALDEMEILQRPTKQDYKDTEKFDFEDTEVAVKTKVATSYVEVPDSTGALHRVYTYEEGYSGLVKYGPETSNMFTANPSKDEKLNVNVSEVVAYFDGVELAKLPVKVEHAWSNGYSSITTDKYTEGKPGYHAIVCDGCGEAHDAQPHTPSPVLDENGNPVMDEEGNEVCWTYNNDQSFLNNGTESSICADCGAVLTRDTFNTADYNTDLANYHFIRVILDYINALLRIINGSIG
ncbi:MAG: hypothetical protein E7530_00500 [Ruminococcaceae bacterium]|nr:hypothetical protein [Oscillospiraceae bacterium]